MDKLHITPTVYFVKHSKQIVETLFDKGGTASGTFKLRKRGILFLLPNGQPFAYLCANEPGREFFVTCHQTDEGIRYMTGGCTEHDEKILGIHGMSFSQEKECANRVWREANALPATPVRRIPRGPTHITL